MPPKEYNAKEKVLLSMLHRSNAESKSEEDQSKSDQKPTYEQLLDLVNNNKSNELVNLKNNNLNQIQTIIANKGSSLLHYAASIGTNNATLDVLIAIEDVDTIQDTDKTPLFTAVKFAQITVVTHLVNCAANLTKKYQHEEKADAASNQVAPLQSMSIVEYAVSLHRPPQIIWDLIRCLVPNGIDENISTENTPILHLCARYGHTAAITYFADEKKANINKNDSQQKSPFIYASYANHNATILEIERLGAIIDPDNQDIKNILEQTSISEDIKNTVKGQIVRSKRRIESESTAQILAEQDAARVAEIIFLTLVADTKSQNQNQQAASLVTILKLFLIKYPYFNRIMPRITHSNDFESKDNPQTISFAQFTKNKLLYFKSEQDKKSFRDLHNPQEISKWQKSLEKAYTSKDEKSIDSFNGLVKKSLDDFIMLEDIEVQIENIASKVIILIDNNNKIDARLLKLWIVRILSNRLKTVSRIDKTVENEMINAIADQISIAVKEQKDILDPHQQGIYEIRIQAALLDSIYKYRLSLSDTERKLYNIAEEIHKSLLIKRNNKDDTKKKHAIERYLLFKALSEEKSIVHSVASSHDNNKLIEYVLINKYKEEKSEDKLNKKLSRDLNVQESYSKFITALLRDFVVHSNLPQINLPLSGAAKELTPNQIKFVGSFCKKVGDYYCMYRALDEEMVQRLQSRVDQVAQIASENKATQTEIKGVNVPIGIIFSLIADLAVYRKDRKVAEVAKRFNWLFCTPLLDEVGTIIRLAGEYIARRYEMQIKWLKLDDDSIERIAVCAAERAIQYITASEKNLVISKPSIFARMWEFIKQSVAYQKYAPILLAEYKDPVTALIDGVIEGESKSDETLVRTSDGRSWLAAGVFRNVGFAIKDENGTKLYRHKDLLVNMQNQYTDPKSNEDRLLLYGYCWLEPSERELIKEHGYEEDSTPLSRVFPDLANDIDVPRRSLN